MKLSLIQPKHNSSLKKIILRVLKEHGAVGAGFAGADPEMDDLFTAYHQPMSRYWVLLSDSEEVIGGGGIGPLKGENDTWCELQKMYFLPKARGLGMGKELIIKALSFAQEHYDYCYLETLNNMVAAQHLYAANGFNKLKEPLGYTGHSGCDVWMSKRLN